MEAIRGELGFKRIAERGEERGGSWRRVLQAEEQLVEVCEALMTVACLSSTKRPSVTGAGE